MKLKKAVLALVALSAMSISIVGAAGIGLVNMGEIYQTYPKMSTYEKKAQEIENKYNPQIQKALDEAKKQTTEQAQQDYFNKNVVPINTKAQEELGKAMEPFYNEVAQRAEQVRVVKNLDVVLTTPAAIVTNPADSALVDITKDVLTLMK